MKKKTIILLSALILTAVGVIIYLKISKKPEPIVLTTIHPQYGVIDRSVTATGSVEPVDTVSVGAQVSGVVKKVYVDFNSIVKKGQLLAMVDPSILAAQNEEAKANLTTAQSNLQYQQNIYTRQTQLYQLGAISKADYQLALNSYNLAKASLANAFAQLRVSDKTLSYTNIYSPVDGVVLNRNVSTGQTIASSFNAPVLFVIAKDLTKMQVNADVDEADIGDVKARQNAQFTVDAFPNDVFKGSVDEILLHPSVSANVVSYTTYIDVDNSSMKLKPGMTASINIYTEDDSNALLIPTRALSFKPDSSLAKQYKLIKSLKEMSSSPPNKIVTTAALLNADVQPSLVWVKSGDSLMERRVLTGIADDTNTQIIAGLSPADEVITTAAGNNKPGLNNTQRSPFMPATQQRPNSNKKN